MYRFKLNLQRFAEDAPEDTTPAAIKVGEDEWTPEKIAELQKNYKKLESQFTKVSQENGDLRKTHDAAEEWLKFDGWVRTLPPELVNEYGTILQNFVQRAQSGNVTQQSITDLNKVIRTVEKSGDDKTAEKLKDQRDEVLEEYRFDKALRDLSKESKKEGFEFDEDEFKDYLTKYLEDEDLLDEDGSFDDRHIRVAYRLYKADKKASALEKDRKDSLPDVGSGGTGVGVGNIKPNEKPKSLKEAQKMVMSWARGK